MAEYIEREALNVAIHESWQSNPHNNPIARQTHNNEHRHFLSLLHKQPTADVAEVRHGEWSLETHSFYADTWDESIELRIYITACCSICGRRHPDRYEVYHKRLYAPEDAPEDFRFDKELEEKKAFEEFQQSDYKLSDHCPDCGARMDGKGEHNDG